MVGTAWRWRLGAERERRRSEPTTRSLDATVEALCGDLSAIRAPRGTELNARSWPTEAPLRMLLNNLDPEVAEQPGGARRLRRLRQGGAQSTRRCARSSRTLLRLGDDETLLVQSGKPVGVFRTHAGAPRVLIANSLLVPRWATWDEFRRLEALGPDDVRPDDRRQLDLHRHAGDPAGHVPDVRGGGGEALRLADLRGRTILTAGLGGMGGAQPLAATMAGAAILCVEVDPSRIERRLETRYLDEATDSLDDALARVRAAAARGARRSRSGCSANAADVVPELARRGEHFDLVTDQTAAHDPLTGYVPQGLDVDEAAALRASDPDEYLRRARASIARTSRACSSTSERGAMFSIMATTCEVRPVKRGVEEAFSYPGFVPAYIRPLFCRGIGPFRWAALSGDPADIAAIDDGAARALPGRRAAPAVARARARAGRVPGPARADLLARLRRPREGGARDQRARAQRARCKAPVVIGRDHLDSGSVASPYRETEAMRDGSDAIADWPILNALAQHRRRARRG